MEGKLLISKEDFATFRFCERVLDNARDMIIESRLLFEANHIRRALFLTITAFEEVLKIIKGLENGFDQKNLKFHSSKFQPATKFYLDRMLPKTNQLVETFLQNNPTLSRDELRSGIENYFHNMADFPKLRQALLYIDFGQDFFAGPLLNSEELLKDMTKIALNGIEEYENTVREIFREEREKFILEEN
ncbi:hypothetical protein AZI87_17450 [Bdellovibrio bacteriovorus]|uniref:HEPN domain-containing protein n=1 Tax=Bdellovibrio bacteriovorus TaxID=959 RepID=A0A162FUC0_BDEBC|nr:AbiV family abortive infection protein [Bdellovibrio bacteriovorus]KYG62310.1 hypothetical protein AZI87_17450 [Bdellovibrio bacteriovorus]